MKIADVRNEGWSLELVSNSSYLVISGTAKPDDSATIPRKQ